VLSVRGVELRLLGLGAQRDILALEAPPHRNSGDVVAAPQPADRPPLFRCRSKASSFGISATASSMWLVMVDPSCQNRESSARRAGDDDVGDAPGGRDRGARPDRLHGHVDRPNPASSHASSFRVGHVGRGLCCLTRYASRSSSGAHGASRSGFDSLTVSSHQPQVPLGLSRSRPSSVSGT
jgi:hypothetical protein